MMIEKEEAIIMAREWVKNRSSECDVFTESIKVVEGHYLITWNTIAYIKSRKFEDMAVGPGYIIINSDSGEIYHLGSGSSAEDIRQSLVHAGRPDARPSNEIELCGKVLDPKRSIMILRKHLPKTTINECRDIVLMAEKGLNPIVELDDEWEAKERAERISKDGISARHVWK